MFLIFSGSGNVLSFQETSLYLGPFLKWLFPGISDPDLRTMMFIIRKGGHVTEYAVLAILCWGAIRVSRPVSATFWQDGRWAVLISFLYAVTDEVHQAMVPSRQGAWQDVLIDTAGALAGLALLWVLGRLLKRW